MHCGGVNSVDDSVERGVWEVGGERVDSIETLKNSEAASGKEC